DSIDLAIRGGLVVTPDGEQRVDIAVAGERIAAIGEVRAASKELDARGKIVLPGCVDLHTHLASTPTWTPLDDFAHGSRAAVAGGVTTVVSMVYQEDGSLRAGLERGLRDATRSIADFSFHVVVTDPSDAARDEIKDLVAQGHAGLKVFMVSPRFVERRDDYVALMRSAAQAGALWIGQPPLREPDDVAAAWDALADGTLDTVGTDHIPHPRAAKLAAGVPFDRIPPGVSNLETMLPMLYSEGVANGRITVRRLV